MRCTGWGTKPEEAARQRACAEIWEGRYRTMRRAEVLAFMSECPSAATAGAYASVYKVVTMAFSFALDTDPALAGVAKYVVSIKGYVFLCTQCKST